MSNNRNLDRLSHTLRQNLPGPLPEATSDTETALTPFQVEALRRKRLANDHAEANLRFRRTILWWVIGVVSVYLGFVAVILSYIACKQGLSATVLIALLSTTTLNILGLPYVIIKSLFPHGAYDA